MARLRNTPCCASIPASWEIAIATADAITPSIARETPAAASLAGRLVSLDVFRGLTIAAMILVNNPGSWEHIYWPLEHARWHGWTPTDLIFPFFLFIVGVSMVLSFTKRIERGAARGSLARHVFLRSAVIFLVGLFLAGFPHFNLSRIRIPGVLQRIAVCYLFAGWIALVAWRRREAEGRTNGLAVVAIIAVIVVLLAGYWAALTYVPVPGYGAGRLDPEGNLGAYLDRKLLAGHVWSQSKTWDPEGILSTFPAIATTLIGALVGTWLLSARTAQRKCAGLLAVGFIGLIVGRLLHPFFPINKNLWTSTYVIFTGGFAMLLLALCYWVADIRGYRRWAAPFLVYGTNALAVFALSNLLAKASIIYKVTVAGPDPRKLAEGAAAAGTVVHQISWHGYAYSRFFAPLASPVNASLLFALFYVLLWLALMWPLYHKRIFIKI